MEDLSGLSRIKENIAATAHEVFEQEIIKINKKFPELKKDFIELELLSTIIKDLESPLRIELFKVLTVELEKLNKPSAAFNTLNEVKRALQNLPFNSQKLLIEDMVSQNKGLKLNQELYLATRLNLEMLENNL